MVGSFFYNVLISKVLNIVESIRSVVYFMSKVSFLI